MRKTTCGWAIYQKKHSRKIGGFLKINGKQMQIHMIYPSSPEHRELLKKRITEKSKGSWDGKSRYVWHIRERGSYTRKRLYLLLEKIPIEEGR